MYLTKEQIQALDRQTPENGMVWVERADKRFYPPLTLDVRLSGSASPMPLTVDGVQINRREPVGHPITVGPVLTGRWPTEVEADRP